MDLIDLLKLKLKNDLLKELSEFKIDNLEEIIDNKITDDLFTTKKKRKQNDILNKDRCCARIMGERYSDERCPYHKVKDDYCRVHLKRLDKYGYLAFKRFDEPRPVINEKGNKIAWRDDSALDDIDTILRYQTMKLQKLINK
tara:strand:+ start:984 stop:1409 length:426 start_codon:yes stop_codon:yes gene_type:complete